MNHKDYMAKIGRKGGKARWKSVSKKDRSRIMRELALKKYAKKK